MAYGGACVVPPSPYVNAFWLPLRGKPRQAELAQGRLRAKQAELAQAVEGCVRAHPRFRAYPNNPAARKAIRAQAKCRKAR